MCVCVNMYLDIMFCWVCCVLCVWSVVCSFVYLSVCLRVCHISLVVPAWYTSMVQLVYLPNMLPPLMLHICLSSTSLVQLLLLYFPSAPTSLVHTPTSHVPSWCTYLPSIYLPCTSLVLLPLWYTYLYLSRTYLVHS